MNVRKLKHKNERQILPFVNTPETYKVWLAKAGIASGHVDQVAKGVEILYDALSTLDQEAIKKLSDFSLPKFLNTYAQTEKLRMLFPGGL